MLELRRQIEKLSTEQGTSHRSLSDARSKCNDYEDQMMQINKEMHSAQEWAKSKFNVISISREKKSSEGFFFVKWNFFFVKLKCNDYKDQMMQVNKEMHPAQEISISR